MEYFKVQFFKIVPILANQYNLLLTVIYYSEKSVTNIEEMLNRDLSSISKHLKCNELIINLSKNKTEIYYDNPERLVTKSNKNSIKSIMEKHTILLVQKCLHENASNTFNKYFEFNHHNKSTRNNVLLKVP